MELQNMINALGETWRQSRSEYHLTLGGFISVLSGVDESLEVRTIEGIYLGYEDSYRGYYADLAFSPSSEKSYVDGVLSQCKKALNSTYHGYKGGDFLMGDDTPLWLAGYSMCGPAIVAATVTDDAVILTTKEVD